MILFSSLLINIICFSYVPSCNLLYIMVNTWWANLYWSPLPIMSFISWFSITKKLFIFLIYTCHQRSNSPSNKAITNFCWKYDFAKICSYCSWMFNRCLWWLKVMFCNLSRIQLDTITFLHLHWNEQFIRFYSVPFSTPEL